MSVGWPQHYLSEVNSLAAANTTKLSLDTHGPAGLQLSQVAAVGQAASQPDKGDIQWLHHLSNS